MNKEIIKRIIILVAMAVIVGPLFINFIFKLEGPEWLVAEWTAGDMLSLFGTLSAALLAMYGISLTITASNSELRENWRNQVRPFIVVEFIRNKPISNNLFKDSETKIKEDVIDEYEEYSLKSFFFIFNEGSKNNDLIDVRRTLSAEQREIIQNGGLINRKLKHGGIGTFHIPYLFLKLSLENVGNGAAVQTSIGLNKRDSITKYYMEPVPLKIGDTMQIGFFADNISDNSKALGKYDLEIKYNDIYGNKYRQIHELDLKYDSANRRAIGSISVEQKQELIEKENIGKK